MTTAKHGGWKRVLLLGAVACLSVVVLLAVGGVATVFWATSIADELGEPALEPLARTVAIAGRAVPQASALAVRHREAVRLEIELQDGSFEIVTGPPGTDVQFDGAYAKNYYELIEERSAAAAPGGPSTAIRLRPTSNVLVRLMATLRASGDAAQQPNKLRVAIPAGLPIALTLRVSQGESWIDLGGLTLTELEADLSMGDHRLGFGRPLAEELQLVRLDGSMGNIELDHLGNARARELRASRSMGNFTADLGGVWLEDGVTTLSFRHSMGDLRLRIPTTVRIAADSQTSVTWGESSQIDGGEETSNPDAPVLNLSLSTTMGETRITRY